VRRREQRAVRRKNRGWFLIVDGRLASPERTGDSQFNRVPRSTRGRQAGGIKVTLIEFSAERIPYGYDVEGKENREQRAEISTWDKGDTEEDRGFGMAGAALVGRRSQKKEQVNTSTYVLLWEGGNADFWDFRNPRRSHEIIPPGAGQEDASICQDALITATLW
jgi:hypothetical protein